MNIAHPTRVLGRHLETTPSTLMGIVRLNIAPPMRALGVYLVTTPSTLTGNELKSSYIYVTNTTTC